MRERVSGDAVEPFLRRVRRGRWIPEPGQIVVVDLGRPATVDDLALMDGKAEIVGGRLEVIAPAGDWPSSAATSMAASLKQHQKMHGGGRAFGSTVAFVVDLPNRRSFCPDVAWYAGPRSDGFPDGAPLFAAEIRDIANYGEQEEEALAAKILDYFAAGTQVVWDVDVLREELIRVYRATDPEHPSVYTRGEMAEAEPAVPGWRFPVDELWD